MTKHLFETLLTNDAFMCYYMENVCFTYAVYIVSHFHHYNETGQRHLIFTGALKCRKQLSRKFFSTLVLETFIEAWKEFFTDVLKHQKKL